MPSQTKIIGNAIVLWYEQNARDLPWRKSNDPYLIWVSEIILQQTTVGQGLSYFHKFMARFPNIETLALASQESVLKVWEGLGYYSRARNMLVTANHIVHQLSGYFPNNYNDLLKLKGIGPYTAAAISSFAFNENKVVVDGNVIRVISRIYGIQGPVDQPKITSLIQKKAQALLDGQQPKIFNQAIMEFGALHCTFKTPACARCSIASFCIAKKRGRVEAIPKKSKKIKKRTRFFQCLHIIDLNNQTIIQKRNGSDIWQGLFQFPLLEYESLPTNLISVPEIFQNNSLPSDTPYKIYKQSLTHQNIVIQFFRLTFNGSLAFPLDSTFLIIDQKNIRTFPFPKFIDLYLNDISIPLI